MLASRYRQSHLIPWSSVVCSCDTAALQTLVQRACISNMLSVAQPKQEAACSIPRHCPLTAIMRQCMNSLLKHTLSGTSPLESDAAPNTVHVTEQLKLIMN